MQYIYTYIKRDDLLGALLDVKSVNLHETQQKMRIKYNKYYAFIFLTTFNNVSHIVVT